MRPFLNSRFPHEIFGETLTSQVTQHCFFTKKHGFDFGRNRPKCAAESNGEEMGSWGGRGVGRAAVASLLHPKDSRTRTLLSPRCRPATCHSLTSGAGPQSMRPAGHSITGARPNFPLGHKHSLRFRSWAFQHVQTSIGHSNFFF